MTPAEQLGRITRTYSPPWTIKRYLGQFVAILPGTTARLIHAKNLDELARQLREAALQRPVVVRSVSRHDVKKRSVGGAGS
jgi:hypothetical protein